MSYCITIAIHITCTTFNSNVLSLILHIFRGQKAKILALYPQEEFSTCCWQPCSAGWLLVSIPRSRFKITPLSFPSDSNGGSAEKSFICLENYWAYWLTAVTWLFPPAFLMQSCPLLSHGLGVISGFWWKMKYFSVWIIKLISLMISECLVECWYDLLKSHNIPFLWGDADFSVRRV